jgi:hypothetical protein
VVGSEGMVLFCGHLKAPISHLWTFSSEVISNTLLTLENTRTWSEIDYRVDICRATGGAHIETF